MNDIVIDIEIDLENNSFEHFGEDVVRLERAKSIVMSHLDNIERVSPGLYKGVGTELYIMEPAGPQIGLWKVKGEVWIARERIGNGDIAVLVTSDEVREKYYRVSE